MTTLARFLGRVSGGTGPPEVVVSSLTLIAGKVATMGFGFLAWIAAARLYAVDEVGLASGAVSAATLCTQFALVGVGSAVISLLPEYADRPRHLVDAAIVVLTVAALVAAAAFLAFANGLLRELQVVGADPVFAGLFTVLTVGGTLGVLFDQTSTASRRGHETLLRALAAGVVTLIVVVIIQAAMPGSGSKGIFVAWALGGVTTAALGAVLVQRLHGGFAGRPTFDAGIARNLVRVGFPNYVLTLTERAPGFVLPIVVTELLSPADNAHWYAAWMMAWVVFVIPIQIGMTSFAEAARDPAAVGRVVRGGIRTSLTLGVVAAVGLGVFAEPVLRLLGHGYADASALPLRILVLGFAPFAVVQAYFSLCRARRQLGGAIALGTVASIASIVVPAVAGVASGLVGMAVAWLGVQVLVAAVAGWRMWTETRRGATRARP
jgi:O-antigen/teichoic acid export membrane protein